MDEKPEAVIGLIAEKERALKAVSVQLEILTTAPEVISRRLDDIEREARRCVDDLRGLLERQPGEARKILTSVLEGPMTVTSVPAEDGPRFELTGRYALGPLVLREGCTSIAGDPNGN